jgi:large subunit ribosomal protein L21
MQYRVGRNPPDTSRDYLRIMYAIIRAGGKQAKVHEGDVLDVELIKNTDTVSYTPLLIVNDDGSVVADTKALGKASVTVEVIGDSAGPKIDIFKYKNKTGYRRRYGHRQKYSRIKVTAITAGGSKKKKKKKSKAKGDASDADVSVATEEA